MTYLLLYCVTLSLVAIRAFQQINILHGHVGLIIPTSYAFGAATVAEFYLLADGVLGNGSVVLMLVALGTGGWNGSLLALYLHRKIASSRKSRPQLASRL